MRMCTNFWTESNGEPLYTKREFLDQTIAIKFWKETVQYTIS